MQILNKCLSRSVAVGVGGGFDTWGSVKLHREKGGYSCTGVAVGNGFGEVPKFIGEGYFVVAAFLHGGWLVGWWLGVGLVWDCIRSDRSCQWVAGT